MSDELRKAARELLDAVEDTHPGWPARLATAMINVRAALAAATPEPSREVTREEERFVREKAEDWLVENGICARRYAREGRFTTARCAYVDGYYKGREIAHAAGFEAGRKAGIDQGKLWSIFRTLLSQGGDIQLDYNAGKYSCHEEYSARLDAAARERVKQFIDRAMQEGKS
jgi:hypothetical protein